MRSHRELGRRFAIFAPGLLACIFSLNDACSQEAGTPRPLMYSLKLTLSDPPPRAIYRWLTTPADDATEGTTESDARNAVFRTQVLVQRFKLASALLAFSTRTNEEVIDALKANAITPSRDAFSDYNIAAIMAGRLRIVEAGPILLPLATDSLDPNTMDLNGVSSFMCFVNAQALAQIGGAEIIEGILDFSKKTESKRDLYVYSWILQESVGLSSATALVRGTRLALGSSTPENDLAVDNLQLMEKLLSGNGVDLDRLFPEELNDKFVEKEIEEK